MTDAASPDSDTAFPTEASAVVIGGGVMGCSTLYHLARLGVADAVLVERHKLTSGTTWHSAAQVRALRSSRNLTDLIRYSIGLYASLEAETGQATGWINKGSLSIATTPDRLTHIRRQEALAHLFDVDARFVSKEEASAIWPAMNAEDVLGAVWSPDDGRVSPSDLCAALIKGAKALGARVFENTAVEGIETRGGRVVALQTARGRLKTGAVALTTGLWSRKLAATAGAGVPAWPCEHFYLLTRPIDGIVGNVPTLSDHDAHLYIRDDSGGLLVGCFEPMGKPIDPDRLGDDFAFQLLPEDWDHFEPMMVNALHRLPALETAEVKMLLNGPESFTPDGSFMLGETAETDGLFLGCGMNSVGIATSGGAGMALAHAMVHGHTPMDLHEADPARFPDCFNTVSALAARVPEVLGRHYEITYPGRQMSTARDLRRTPLDCEWRDADARFAQVYGWERPLYFGGPRDPALTFARPAWFDAVGEEVRAAHTGAAVFDQSTFGKIRVEGPDAEVFLDRVCANAMTRAPGRAIYTAMLNPRGGLESDLTALRLTPDSYRLYVGSSAIRRDMAWLRRHLREDERVEIRDETEAYAVIALMGPDSARIATAVGADDLNALGYFAHGESAVAGRPVRAARLSYVGEPGWEITCRAEDASAIYAALAADGARPAGLFAQTSMRIEKGFLAYGHDIDTDTDPLQLGLGFAVDWSSDFVGKPALERLRDAPRAKRAATLIFDGEAWPIGNEPVYLDSAIVGATTSAAYGYRVGAPVAIAMLDMDAIGETVEVDIAGVRHAARTLEHAAFDPKGDRMRQIPGA